MGSASCCDRVELPETMQRSDRKFIKYTDDDLGRDSEQVCMHNSRISDFSENFLLTPEKNGDYELQKRLFNRDNSPKREKFDTEADA